MDNAWLRRMYTLRNKWVKCYLKNTSTLGIRSTQLSESLNSDLKEYLKSTLDVVQFFKHFERVLNQKRGNELKAKFEARNKLPRLVNSISIIQKQAGELYTPTIYALFQEEYNWMTVCCIRDRTDRIPFIDFRVGIVDVEGEYQVCCNPLAGIIGCACRKFETDGLLYCHCLKVLDVLDIKRIPDSYILKRWTRGARTMVVNDNRGKKLKRMSTWTVHSEASNTVEGYELMKDAANELRLKVGNIRINPADCPDMRILPDFSTDESISHISSQAYAVHQSQASAVHQSLDEDCYNCNLYMNVLESSLCKFINHRFTYISEFKCTCLLYVQKKAGSKIVVEEILRVLKEAEWEPSLHWKSFPTEFSEDSPYDLVAFDGKTTINPSEWTFHRKIQRD
ncbi:protein FAR1-RELATED SEQUENCE 5-like [Macadamia integrifolia]|uniref:protein FAR1-RELATED SEQUENCE 5-like n=1 Tax=Macadamia integrifolia TaxID=60698 RepID=UPI001C4ED57E|nr:protein FAR1-RELATED SEQUENCE 5-like [Macadamia integrifolia]